MMKTCTKCGEEKPFGQFGAGGDPKRGGLRSDCKACRNARIRMRRQLDADLAKRERESCLVWRAKNPNHGAEYMRQFRLENPDAVRETTHQRRARIKNAPGRGVTASDIRAQMIAQHGQCAACSCDVSVDYHVDHIMPLARGGAHDPDNIQILCPTCNMSKGAKTMDEWLQTRCAA